MDISFSYVFKINYCLLFSAKKLLYLPILYLNTLGFGETGFWKIQESQQVF